MICQRCPQLRQELQRTRDNVRLIEDLLEDARRREKTQDTLDRLAMLHRHCRTNYDDMANLTFALNHCQNQPRCPGQWNHVPNQNYELSHGWRESRTPPNRGAIFQRHVASLKVWRKWHKKWRCRATGHVAVGRSLGVSTSNNSSVDDTTPSPLLCILSKRDVVVNKFLVSRYCPQ